MRDVFVSRPSTRNEEQEEFLDHFDEMLRNHNLRPWSLGQTDYSNKTPILAVRNLMEECEGAIILGLVQLHVKKGVKVPESDEETVIDDLLYPTPWNHIEAGMAFMLEIPVLLIREKGITGGVFSLGSVDQHIHEATLTKEWINSREFLDPFNQWHEEVVQQ